MHRQQSFCDLEMKPADDDDSSCDSVSSSFSDSISSAMASGLTITDTDRPVCKVNAADSGTKSAMGRNAVSKASCGMKPEPPDFVWLQERCDGDIQLVHEVLRCFGEQGQAHLQAMQSAMKEKDTQELVFHAVKK
jgi:hypothetical protein